MAGVALIDKDNYDGKITGSVILTCIMAASGGLIFGYDIGISGGVTSMESFLKEFFPEILDKMGKAKQDEYCVFDSQILTAFTSSLYIAGLFASLFATTATKNYGRLNVMLIGGAAFFIGAALNASAVNIAMLIIGRIMLGFGVGFTNQATPVYLAEVAPARWRGALTTGFQFFIGIGVLAANLTNFATSLIPNWGWRLSLGLAGVPASILFLAALLIPDTPSSLLQRGHVSAARSALLRLRGPMANIEAELRDIAGSIEAAKVRDKDESQFRRIGRRRYRAQLVMAVAMPLFQQMTGVVVIAFFAPVLFRTVGFGSQSALMSAVILGGVNLISILIASVVVDRYGRKVLFLQGGLQIIICEVAVAWILGSNMGPNGETNLPRGHSIAVLVLMCAYSAGFGWSWGPLSWVVPSEIFPVEIRSAGQSINVAVNLGVTFIQTQVFLSMLCHLKYGVFIFYAAWIAVMTIFVIAFLPETKGVPLDSMMNSVWARHWFWRRFVVDEEVHQRPVSKT
ncbi:sugar transport protein MST1 [Dioscorea cayenensis subsp. rotundata]|uniref:Sugar transport protein MST1 n=1 Tax=Dioscorea cayennensis subsp. rotundata TaxID=55577 RepID=A0AB40D2V4_DIOCR|nr:sugar transport protein MST1 [Dioscorea cayenensis subsp. rotundata]